MRILCGVFHTAMAALLLAAVAIGWLDVLALAAFAPVIVRALRAALRPDRHLNLRRIGRLEVVYSLIFLGLLPWHFGNWNGLY